MIYIDPPYNTGNDFVYHDDFPNLQMNTMSQIKTKKEIATVGIPTATVVSILTGVL